MNKIKTCIAAWLRARRSRRIKGVAIELFTLLAFSFEQSLREGMKVPLLAITLQEMVEGVSHYIDSDLALAYFTALTALANSDFETSTDETVPWLLAKNAYKAIEKALSQ